MPQFQIFFHIMRCPTADISVRTGKLFDLEIRGIGFLLTSIILSISISEISIYFNLLHLVCGIEGREHLVLHLKYTTSDKCDPLAASFCHFSSKKCKREVSNILIIISFRIPTKGLRF